MEQLSIFDILKPQIRIKNDKSWINEKLVKGAIFELFMETENHYHVFLDETYYGIYKKDCEVIK